MKKRLKRLLVLLLTFCLILSQMTIPVFAEINDSYEYKWVGSLKTYYIIQEGTFREYAKLYQLQDSAKNNVYAYCADWQRPTYSDVKYKRMNLEDSEYFKENAGYIRAILKNGYWPSKSGSIVFGHGWERALSATQVAIWHWTNPEATPRWGDGQWNPEGKEVFALAKKLWELPAEAPSTKIFSDNYFIKSVDVKVDGDFSGNGVEDYDITVDFELEMPAVSTDSLKIMAVLGSETETINLQNGKSKYSIAFKNVSPTDAKTGTVKLDLSGTQYAEDYYFYEAYGEDDTSKRENSQNMVGWYAGDTKVAASKTVSFDLTSVSLEKKNEEGTALSGAKFKLVATKDGNTTIVYENLVTNSSGKIKVSDLPTNGYTYYFVETKAPEGYATPSTNQFTVANGKTVTVTNKALETEVIIGGSKKIIANNGTVPTAGFTFELKDSKGTVIDTENLKESRDFTFDPIQYSYADVGKTYSYTVSEQIPSGDKAGWNYDIDVYKVKVTVGYDSTNNELTTNVQKPNGNIEFTNEYIPAATDITFVGTKTVSGEGNIPTEGFEFGLWEGTDTSKEPIQTKIVNNIDPTSKSGSFTFDKIEYTTAGTYYYTIAERGTGENGWTYDVNDYTIKVTVTDDGLGHLSAKSDVNNSSIVFNNVYEATDTEITLGGYKTIEGNGTVPTEGFEFGLWEGTDTSKTPIRTAKVTTVDSETKNNSFTFDKVEYTEKGNYTYTIAELGTAGRGWTYDKNTYTVNVTVTDNGEGQLVATADIQNENIVFVNKYKVDSTKLTLSGTKSVVGKDASADTVFTFTLEDESGTVIDTKTTTATEAAAGTFTFDEITYTEPGVHTYYVKETALDNDHWTCDENVYTVTVTVEDKGGYLDKTVAIKEADGDSVSAIEFTNTYAPTEISTTITGTKNVTGAYAPDNAQFTFVMKDSNGNTVGTKTSGKGDFSFDTPTYTESGEYVYKISEVGKNNDNWKYDKAEFEVKVVVTMEEGTDNLKATVIYPETGVVFTNEYTASAAKATIFGSKKVEGTYAPTGTEFTFVLEDSEGNEIERVSRTDTGSFNFTELEYTTTGEYVYKVKEIPLENNKWTCDTTEHTVTVTVTNNNGVLSANVTYPENRVTFTNTYDAGNASAVIGGTKAVTGKDAPTDTTFTFELKDSNNNVVRTATRNGAGDFTFDPIEYATTGVYEYTVSEVALTDTDHWKCDDAVYTVKVTVSNNNGVLSTSVDTAAADVKFVNAYTPDKTSVEISGTKVVNGKDAPEGTVFTFILKEKGSTDVLQTATVTDNGTFKFDAIEYTESGTYKYEVSEQDLGLENWDCDDTVYEVVVTVEKDGDALQASVDKTTAEVKFTNTYHANKTSAVISGNKVVKGEYAPSNTEFTFELREKGSNEVLKTATVTDGGAFAFGAIEYTESGEYTYEITEQKLSNENWDCDDTVYEVVVTVTKEGNSLVADVAYPENGVEFTNEYTPAPAKATIGGTKAVDGAYAPTDTTFTFVLKNSNNEEVDTVTHSGAGEFTFMELSYTSEGTYEYTVSEVALSDTELWDCDTKVYEVVVTVTNDNGVLTATVDKSAADVVFTNTYKVKETSAEIGGTKIVESKDAPKDTEFVFVLKNSNDEEIDRASRNGAGEFKFDAISYKEEGEYVYTVSEIALDDTDHWTCDDTIYTVTVTVTNNNGVLTATVDKDADAVAFENIYTAEPTTATIGGTKAVSGKDAPTDTEFTFVLKDSNGAEIDRVSHIGEGTFEFDAIDYTEGGVYTYTVVEEALADNHWVCDETVYTVTVTVEAKDHKLTAKVNKQAADVKFTNTYAAEPTSAVIGGSKVITGEDVPAATFTFQLKENGNVIDEATLSEAGTFTFDEITYTETGVHNYTVTEVAGGEKGWSYDSTVYNVKVTVTEENGALAAEVVYENGDVVFTNDYTKPAPTATEVTIEGEKFVKGISETDEEFTFILAEGGVQIDSVTIEGKGSFEFDTITYTEEGTHTYTVFELDGDAENWKYDNHKFKVTVNVTEDAEGNLKAEVNYVDGAIKFTNTYKEPVQTPSDATPSDATSSNATAAIKGEKRIQGIGSSNKLFTFILMEDGVEIDRASTMGAGFFKFDTLKFTEEGEHTYTVHELQGDAAGWTYDDTVYTVTIVVTKEGNKLVAEVEYEDGAIVFTNIYEEPEKPTVPGKKEDDDDDDTPKPTKSTEPETVPETVTETAPEAPSEVLGDEDIVGYDPNGVLGAYDQLPVGVLPATGDSALIWVLGMILSGLGLTGVNFKSKKRKNK